MGRTHVEAIGTIEDAAVELVVCDPSPEARAWAGSRGLGAFTDLGGAAAAGRLDAVIIAAVTSAHVALVTEAFELGAAVLCEKPGGTSPLALRQLGADADRAGNVLRLAYWHRFVPALRRIRDAVRAGDIGDVLALSSAQWDGFPPSPEFLSGSGGELVDMGVHELDFARWTLECELHAHGAAWRSNPRGHNAGVALLQSDGGTVVTVSTGRVLEGGQDGCWVEVLGTKRSLFERWLWGDVGEVVNRQGVADQDREFLRLVAGRPSDVLATAEEAAAVLALANALTQAAGAPRLVPATATTTPATATAAATATSAG
jgi:predicted dehydrogenase